METKRCNEQQKITIATAKDFDISYYCGSGPGGQARNKSATAVQIIHRESGAIGKASDSRSQMENRTNAFKRLVKTPQFQFWLAKKKFEIENQQTMEEAVERELREENLKFEVRGEGGWKEVDEAYFSSAIARMGERGL